MMALSYAVSSKSVLEASMIDHIQQTSDMPHTQDVPHTSDQDDTETPHATPVMQLISVTMPIPCIDGLTFLRHAPAGTRRFFWENDRQDWRYAGFGITAEVTATGASRFGEIRTQIGALFANAHFNTPPQTPPEALPRVFGGFAFQPGSQQRTTRSIWKDFPDASFALPQVLLATRGQDTWLTVTVYTDHSVEAAVNQLRRSADKLANRLAQAQQPQIDAAAPDLNAFNYPLTRDRWHAEISEATDCIKAGDLDKVVLARICDLEFSESIDPLSALHQLKQYYAETYRFLIEIQPERFFFGATPELLVETHGRQLTTAAVAGSIRRGDSPEDDSRMAAQLYQSAKERHEHHLVSLAIEDALLPLTTKLNVPDSPEILKLSNIQHLYTPISATLKDSCTLLDAVEQLHPTPAVGGYPRQTAVQLIDDVEQFPRGWYASPVGWIDAQGDGMFVVALRSAVADGKQARLYAGVGIVADSDPDREWDETNLKFRPILNAFGIEA